MYIYVSKYSEQSDERKSELQKNLLVAYILSSDK